RGDVVRKWGLDYEDVRRVRPDVVYVASQGFGRGGPLGEASAYGPLNSAFAGVTWLWNHPDAPYPAGSSLNHPDHIAAKLVAVAGGAGRGGGARGGGREGGGAAAREGAGGAAGAAGSGHAHRAPPPGAARCAWHGADPAGSGPGRHGGTPLGGDRV